jgi:hypothetical protein
VNVKLTDLDEGLEIVFFDDADPTATFAVTELECDDVEKLGRDLLAFADRARARRARKGLATS